MQIVHLQHQLSGYHWNKAKLPSMTKGAFRSIFPTNAPTRETTSGTWLPTSPLASALGFVALPAAYWSTLPFLLVAYLALAQALKRYFALG